MNVFMKSLIIVEIPEKLWKIRLKERLKVEK